MAVGHQISRRIAHRRARHALLVVVIAVLVVVAGWWAYQRVSDAFDQSPNGVSVSLSAR